jgi:hypothetical protein
MISRRLSIILGAKCLKVSDVCQATGVAHITIDRYYYDKVNSFDRDVLSKLTCALEFPILPLTRNCLGLAEWLLRPRCGHARFY